MKTNLEEKPQGLETITAKQLVKEVTMVLSSKHLQKLRSLTNLLPYDQEKE